MCATLGFRSLVTTKFPISRLLACLALTLMVVTFAASAPAHAANTQGAAFTTFVDPSQCLNGNGNGINCNIYASKEGVYINGGPASGNLSDGCYYFTVIAPGFQNGGFIDGADGNLSDTTPSNGGPGGGDASTNRIFKMEGHNVAQYPSSDCGSVTTTAHATGIDPQGHNVVQLMPYDDTPNPGGVYIAAICVVGATSPAQCKYDAFKIKSSQPPPCTENCGTGGSASITVCKFWDQNGDHQQDGDEPLLGAWPITATNVDGDTGSGLTQNTTNTVIDGAPVATFGCTTFTHTFPPNGNTSVEVTLTEGSSPSLGSQYCDSTGCPLTTPTGTWTQSAPFDGTNVLSSKTYTLNINDNIVADAFGNWVAQDLTVSKTAIPSFTRTYSWTIAKSNNRPDPVEQGSGSVSVNYTVTTGFTTQDSDWKVSGTITVTNTNPVDFVANISDDDSANGGSCAVTDGLNVTVPANGSVDRAYVCTFTSNPGSGTNTAAAAWDKAVYHTPTGSAQGPQTFDFSGVAPNIQGFTTITATDAFNGGAAITLGTVNALTSTTTPNTNPATDGGFTITSPSFGVFAYTRSIAVVRNCVTYTNTATISETGQTASSSVEICGFANTGALTMGFWQNKNGQGIIKNYSGTNCQSLATWLKAFHPFSTLASSTTCGGSPSTGASTSTGVIGYIYNVIKAAQCSGPVTAPCNAMLKSQMLATALDVYFSTTTLGGNRIGAPAAVVAGGGIGAISIDLSKICSMIDGSGGGGSCSGSYGNVASLFGVTKCDTILAMLQYQNTSDPAADAGAVWYGNVKANQVGAKNAFDAINNQVVFPCP